MRGPKRTYRPRFGPKELEEARAVFGRRKSPQGRARRAHLAILLAEEPDIPHLEAAGIVGERQQDEGRQEWSPPRSRQQEDFPSTFASQFRQVGNLDDVIEAKVAAYLDAKIEPALQDVSCTSERAGKPTFPLTGSTGMR